MRKQGKIQLARLVLRAAGQWWRSRRAYRNLLNRDDRLLRDIGLTRERAEALRSEFGFLSILRSMLR